MRKAVFKLEVSEHFYELDRADLFDPCLVIFKSRLFNRVGLLGSIEGVLLVDFLEQAVVLFEEGLVLGFLPVLLPLVVLVDVLRNLFLALLAWRV